jgi:serine-type D-Ala-D-Ala carboxypeptidase (penicillin-binding protein 5/6)
VTDSGLQLGPRRRLRVGALLLMGVLAMSALVAALAATPARAAGSPVLQAREAALIDASTERLLYGYAINRPVAIASTTKLMTALVTLEHVSRLQTVFTQNDYRSAAVDSQLGLVPGERMTVRDLLLAMLLPSADDAAEDLAYNVGHGSVARFVAMMNARARQLGLTRTHYSTPIGLDTAGNYSTALDLAKLTGYLLAHQPFFARAVASSSVYLPTGPVRRVTNRNDLVGRVPWINGVKTGHTLDAGYVLIGSGTQHGMTLIAPVLGTPSESARDQSTLSLLQWGFANFVPREPVVAGTVLARLPVKDQSRRAVVVAARSYRQVFPRAAVVRTRLELPAQLEGPLPRHAVVGHAVVIADGKRVATVPLVVARAVPGVGALAQAIASIGGPITLVVVVLLLGAAIGTRVSWRGRVRAAAAGGRR